MPIIMYQFLMFVMPALTHQERKMVLLVLPLITVMFGGGVYFGYRFLIPPAIDFLLKFGSEVAEAQIRMSNYINFITRLLLAIGIIFELPVVTTFLARMGILTSKSLADRRRIMIILSFVLAAFITPTPDAVNQSIVAGTLIVLYEISIWMAKLAERRRAKAAAAAESTMAQP
jgi:sec-independent protein translocase protein TatC